MPSPQSGCWPCGDHGEGVDSNNITRLVSWYLRRSRQELLNKIVRDYFLFIMTERDSHLSQEGLYCAVCLSHLSQEGLYYTVCLSRSRSVDIVFQYRLSSPSLTGSAYQPLLPLSSVVSRISWTWCWENITPPGGSVGTDYLLYNNSQLHNSNNKYHFIFFIYKTHERSSS